MEEDRRKIAEAREAEHEARLISQDARDAVQCRIIPEERYRVDDEQYDERQALYEREVKAFESIAASLLVLTKLTGGEE